jgi:hypothetical protein
MYLFERVNFCFEFFRDISQLVIVSPELVCLMIKDGDPFNLSHSALGGSKSIPGSLSFHLLSYEKRPY